MDPKFGSKSWSDKKKRKKTRRGGTGPRPLKVVLDGLPATRPGGGSSQGRRSGRGGNFCRTSQAKRPFSKMRAVIYNTNGPSARQSIVKYNIISDWWQQCVVNYNTNGSISVPLPLLAHPRAAQSSPEQPGSSPGTPKATQSGPGQPRAAQSSPEQPRTAQTSPDQPRPAQLAAPSPEPRAT